MCNLSNNMLQRYGGEYIPDGVVEGPDHIVHFRAACGVLSG